MRKASMRRNLCSPHREQGGLTLLLVKKEEQRRRTVRWGGEEVRGEEKIDEVEEEVKVAWLAL